MRRKQAGLGANASGPSAKGAGRAEHRLALLPEPGVDVQDDFPHGRAVLGMASTSNEHWSSASSATCKDLVGWTRSGDRLTGQGADERHPTPEPVGQRRSFNSLPERGPRVPGRSLAVPSPCREASTYSRPRTNTGTGLLTDENQGAIKQGVPGSAARGTENKIHTVLCPRTCAARSISLRSLGLR